MYLKVLNLKRHVMTIRLAIMYSKDDQSVRTRVFDPMNHFHVALCAALDIYGHDIYMS